jgi:hypothetical protein
VSLQRIDLASGDSIGVNEAPDHRVRLVVYDASGDPSVPEMTAGEARRVAALLVAAADRTEETT